MKNVIKAPNKILRKKIPYTTDIDQRYTVISQDMFKIIKQDSVAGLAANQIGYEVPMIAIKIPEQAGEVNKVLFIINPEIVETKGTISFREKCLSLPGVTCVTERYREVRVKGMDLHGQYISKRFRGITSVVVQHEIDHLHGRLMTDHGTIVEQKRVKNEEENKRSTGDIQRGKGINKSDGNVTLH